MDCKFIGGAIVKKKVVRFKVVGTVCIICAIITYVVCVVFNALDVYADPGDFLSILAIITVF